MNNHFDDEEIYHLLNSSEDELLADLGNQLLSEGVHYAIKPSEKQLIESAKSWIQSNSLSIRESLCKSKILCNWVCSRENRRLEVFREVVNILSSIFLGIGVITLTALLMKYKLENICKSYWRYVATESGKKYHRIGCRAVKGRKISNIWSSIIEAQKTHVPCCVCNP